MSTAAEDVKQLLALFENSDDDYSDKESSILAPVNLSELVTVLEADEKNCVKYRELQHVQLTQIQSQILAAISKEKIKSAPLRELVNAFKILKERELVAAGKPSDIQGLVAYLVHLEGEAPSKVRERQGIETAKDITPVCTETVSPEDIIEVSSGLDANASSADQEPL